MKTAAEDVIVGGGEGDPVDRRELAGPGRLDRRAKICGAAGIVRRRKTFRSAGIGRARIRLRRRRKRRAVRIHFIFGGQIFEDDLPREAHVLRGVGGTVFCQDLSGTDSVLQQVVPHTLAFRDGFVRALAAGDDKDEFLPGLVELAVIELDGPVQTAPEKRCRSSVGPDTAAQDDQVVPVKGRLDQSGDPVGHDGAHQHAFEIEENSRKEVDAEVVKHVGARRPEDAGLAEDQEDFAQEDHDGQDHPENVRKTFPFAPDEGDVGDKQSGAEGHEDRHGQDHKGPGGVKQGSHQRVPGAQPVCFRKAAQHQEQKDLENEEGEKEKAGVVNDVVGVGIVFQLLPEGVPEEEQRGHAVETEKNRRGADRAELDFLSSAGSAGAVEDEKDGDHGQGEGQKAPELWFFCPGIKGNHNIVIRPSHIFHASSIL